MDAVVVRLTECSLSSVTLLREIITGLPHIKGSGRIQRERRSLSSADNELATVGVLQLFCGNGT